MWEEVSNFIIMERDLLVRPSIMMEKALIKIKEILENKTLRILEKLLLSKICNLITHLKMKSLLMGKLNIINSIKVQEIKLANRT